MFRLQLLFLVTLLAAVGTAEASERPAISLSTETSDTVSHSVHAPTSYAIRYIPGRTLALDSYTKTWLKRGETHSVAVEAHWDTHLMAADTTASYQWMPYARDYGWPAFSVGLRWNFNHGTLMHRDAEDWGEAMEVPYTTRLGDVVTLYGRFDRSLVNAGRRLTAGYSLGMGIGYALSCYDKTCHIDNELIGTHLNIFFTAALWLRYRITPYASIEAGADFAHHSNGALYRPNKGANYLGPYVSLIYTPGYQSSSSGQSSPRTPESQTSLSVQPLSLYLELTPGIGAKTLNEDWQRTQFYTEPGASDYRTDKFPVYAALSFQTSLMCRYARRFASGIGIDLFHGTYASKVRRLEQAEQEQPRRISPWSVGMALRHQAHFGRLSVRMGIGFYLFRRMGTAARAVETPYYEHIGLFYSLTRHTGPAIGISVFAHKTKADFTMLQLTVPVRL